MVLKAQITALLGLKLQPNVLLLQGVAMVECSDFKEKALKWVTEIADRQILSNVK